MEATLDRLKEPLTGLPVSSSCTSDDARNFFCQAGVPVELLADLFPCDQRAWSSYHPNWRKAATKATVKAAMGWIGGNKCSICVRTLIQWEEPTSLDRRDWGVPGHGGGRSGESV